MKRILWFRRNLRVQDNPLLSIGGEVLPLFIFDTTILGKLNANDKRVNLIFDYVSKLKKDLQTIGLDLKVYWGDPLEIFAMLEAQGFDEVVASGDYDAYAKERDLKVSHILHFKYLHDTYIFKPHEVLKEDGTPYLVYTPFYNKAKTLFTKTHLQMYPLAEHTLHNTTYEGISKVDSNKEQRLPLELVSLGFESNLPTIAPLEEKLEALRRKLAHYQKERDFLNIDATSHLSVELRFGVISLRSLLRLLVEVKKEGVDTEPYFRQLIFRDYYAYLLYHFPHLASQNHKYNFNGVEDKEKFTSFCEARTGLPIIDAGVRELLETGDMHNRVRMICASFFTKDLLLPWQWGEKFFAKYLLDYDAASNILSWQWSAGTGIDPQPYFRIFNPYLQSKKFDKDAIYIKKWVPQLAKVENKKIHNEGYLLNTDIEDYPKPILIRKEAVDKALTYFKQNR